MKYLFHLGFQKCGTSLLSSILDSHLSAIIALDETSIITDKSLTKEQVIENLKLGSAKYRIRRDHDNYDYTLWGQGIWDPVNLKLIGHKGGWDNVQAYLEDPSRLDHFVKKMEMPFLSVLSTRNPFDMLSGVWTWKQNRRNNIPIIELAKRLNEIAAGNQELMDMFPCMIVKLENLIYYREHLIRDLCRFLSLREDEVFIRSAEQKLFSNHHTFLKDDRLGKVPWDDESIGYVSDMMKKWDFFRGYEIPEELR